MQPLQRNYQPQQKTTEPLFKQRKFVVSVTTVVLFLLFIFFTLPNRDDKKPENTNAVNASNYSEQENPENPKKTVDTSTLAPALSAILKKYPNYATSVSIVDLNSGKTIQAGDDYPFVAASTTKLITALLFLNNVEAGQDNLNNKINGVSAEQHLQRMINKSDNESWHAINDLLTKGSLTAYAQKQGLSSFDAEKNVVTTNDMALLIKKLYAGDLINKKHTELLYSWMQNTSEERFIPPNISGDTKLFHKAGYLKDRVHDVAIVDDGTTPYAIVIFSKSFGDAQYDYAAGQRLFGELTALAEQLFN